MASKNPDYITASANAWKYTTPYQTQALPQTNFAQYTYQDPQFGLGMLIGNAIMQNIAARKQKEADQQLFRQQNPVSMPDNVPLYDTSTTPTLADGKTAAIGNAYSGFGANPSQVSNDFLANVQSVPGRMNYNADTGAVTYQAPTFLPSMYAANNLGNYYPTATDSDGNLIGDISFADYLNNQSKANQGQGLLDFATLGRMAADDAAKAAAKNPQATVSQSMGVLPTAPVDVPPANKQNIPAINGQLGQPINGNLSFGKSLIGNTWTYRNPYLKNDGSDADALPGTETSAQTTAPGMIAPGNVDTTSGLPKAKVVTIDDKHYVLPATAPDGTTLNADQTAYNFYETGNTLGVFDSKKAADKYAAKINKGAGDNPTPVGNVHAMTQQPIDTAPIQEQPAPIQPVDTQPIKPVDNQPIKEQPAPIQPVDEQPIKPTDATQTAQAATPDQTNTTVPASAQSGTQVTITSNTPPTQQNATDNAENMGSKSLFPNDPEKLMDTLFPGETQVDNPAYKDLLDQYNKETDPAKKQALMDKLDNTSKYLLRSPNAEYIAAKQLVDAETDDKKKKEMMGYLNNIAPYNMRPLAPTEGSLRTNLNGGAPPHVDAQKNEADFLHWAIQHNVPMDIVNSELEVYRPQWQAQEQKYNQYQASALYPVYYQAAMKGDYSTAATIAQSMEKYDPALASLMFTNIPGGRDYYATGVKKDMARDANNYKMQQMGAANKYTLGQIAFRGKIDEHMLDKKQAFQHKENVEARNFKAKEDAMRAQAAVAAAQAKAAHSGGGGGSSSGGGSGDGGGKPSKGDEKIANNMEYLWERVIDSANNNNLATDEGHDIVESLRKYVADHAGDFTDDAATYANAKAAAAEFLLMKAEGNENEAAEMAAYIPDYYKHELLPNYY